MAVVADELLLVVKSNVTSALAGLEAVETKAGGMGGAFKTGAKVAGGAILGIGAAAGIVGVASAGLASSFESSMAQIEANVGTTGAELDTLKQAALDMGREFGVSANDAAEGLFFLQSAGLSVDDSISALRTSSMMASMGLGDMTGIANGLTTAMTNWGISSEEAGNVVAKAVELGKAAPEEMTKILNQNAAAAAATGMEFDDMATITAYLTRVTGDANKSGTQMQGILAKLIKPSQQGKDMIESLGGSFEDFAKAMAEDPVNALKDFDQAFADSGVSSNEWMGKVFEDVNAINGAMSILNSDGEEMTGMFDSMADRGTKVADGFGVIAETAEFRLGAALEGLKSALIPIGAVILEYVVPAIEAMANWLMVGVEWVQNLLGGSEDMGEGIGNVFSDLMDGIAAVRDWINDHIDEIEAIFNHLWEVVEHIWNEIWAFLEPLIEDIVSTVEEWMGELVAWFEDNWPKIQETIHTVLEFIKGYFDFIWPYLSNVIEIAWGVIKAVIDTTLGVILGIIQTVMGVITGDWEYAWNSVKGIVEDIWNGIVGVVEPIVDGFATHIQTAIEDLGAVWDAIWEGMGSTVQSVWGNIKSWISTGVNGALRALETMVNGVVTAMNHMIQGWNNANLFLNFADISKLGYVSLPRVSLAEGGVALGRGVIQARVGERGPEDVLLPAGSEVRPTNSGGPMIGTIVMQGGDAKDVAAEVGWELIKRGLI